MRKSIYFLSIIFLVFSNCGKARIDLVSKNSGVNLPEKYDIVKNETKDLGGPDFEINVVLQFDKENFNYIIKQTDSLAKVNSNWKKSDQSADYINRSNESEPEEIKIDLNKRTLYFNLVHL
ncbi:hypothetical protein LZZ90_10810 [Flavobacterium sp. SM15]|uniref:hypothetical protein n=1 Tax=Flavobacterium sp. SM15 TaxID=2908005 RepID=UPI001ED9FC0D|nr:hypothetical protein [Flavobacterium sp. SM15]MCG2611997.1 hypothetical protein [Flavobacterium sp. SM15]